MCFKNKVEVNGNVNDNVNDNVDDNVNVNDIDNIKVNGNDKGFHPQTMADVNVKGDGNVNVNGNDKQRTILLDDNDHDDSDDDIIFSRIKQRDKHILQCICGKTSGLGSPRVINVGDKSSGNAPSPKTPGLVSPKTCGLVSPKTSGLVSPINWGI